MPDSTINFIMRADTAQGKAAIEGFTRALTQTGQQAGKSVSSFRSFEEGMNRRVAQTAKYAAAAAALALAGLAAASVKMAVDAVESENLFSVSMGRMGQAARAWSEEMSATLGLNAFEVRKSIGTFNVMLNSMGLAEQAAYDMAKGLTQLSYDMASFYNLKPAEAFQKLQSGITGEIEPLKRLGIVVNENTTKQIAYAQGIAKFGAELTEAQKIQARYLGIMQQTSVAQGDLARTIDSPANAMRILQSRSEQLMIQLGQALIPTLQGVIVIMGDLIRWLQGGAENLRFVAKAALLPVQAFQILRGGMLGVITLTYAVINAFVDMGAAVLRTVDIFNLFKPFHAWMQEGVEGSRAKMLEFGVAGIKVQDEIIALEAALENLGSTMSTGAAPVRALSTDVDKLTEKHKKAAKVVDEHAEDLERFRKIFVEVRPELDATDKAWQRYLDTLLAITFVQDPLRNAELRRLNTLRLTKESAEAATEDGLKARQAAASNLQKQADAVTEAAQQHKETLDSLTRSIKEGLQTPVQEATTSFRELVELLGSGRISATEFSQATERIQASLNGAAQFGRQFGKEIGDAFTQMIIYGRGGIKMLQGLLEIFVKAILQATLFKSIFQALGGTKAEAGGGIGGFFAGIFGSLAGLKFQSGGRPPMNTVSLVGERGPELFIPDRPGTIAPISGGGRTGGSSPVINNYIDARGADAAVEYRVMRALQAVEARAAASARQQMQQAALRS